MARRFAAPTEQIAGLREIPTPAITLVPVGIRVIGPMRKRRCALPSEEQTTSCSHIVSAMLASRLRRSFKAADHTMPSTVRGRRRAPP
jgi:hypothetical protein